MEAARVGADNMVTFLLSVGADPDLTDILDKTALIHAIDNKCHSTIALLAPLTRKSYGAVLASLARSQPPEMTHPLQDLITRAAMDPEAVRIGLYYATTFGAAGLLKMLTDKRLFGSEDANSLLENAVNSDDAETVKVVLGLTREVSSENIELALTRGREDVVHLLGMGDDHCGIEIHKKWLKTAINEKTACISDRLPKSVEFAYNDEMTKLRPLLSKSMVSFEDLVDALQVPPVHAEEECPEE